MLVLFVKLFEVNCGNRDESLKLWNYVDPSNVFIYVRKYRDIYEKKKNNKNQDKNFSSIHPYCCYYYFINKTNKRLDIY